MTIPRPFRRGLGFRPFAAALLAAFAVTGPARAQVDPSPADTVAAEYLRGFQAAVWDGLAQRLHPDALAYLRLAIDIQVDADTFENRRYDTVRLINECL